jgi:hypothetical protein
MAKPSKIGTTIAKKIPGILLILKEIVERKTQIEEVK